ncbi:MAG: serine/threonine-protein kinase [Polyangiales bacterium]
MIPGRVVLERSLGERLKQRYRLVALVGSGGQGAVYRAVDERDGDVVAVKILHERINDDPIARERLVREARALVALSDTAAVRVLDQGFTSDGRLGLVIEMLEGQDLESALERLEFEGREPSAAEVPFVFAPIVDTLERAHALDIVHRDLKPANVFLERKEGLVRVRLLDFGFAKLSRMPRLTQQGTIAGSPSYIAPESWFDHPVTPLVDVYALGATIFRFLAGEPPFTGEGPMAIMRKVTLGPRPSLHAFRPDLPPEIDDWAAMALAVRPEERFQSARALYRALESVLARLRRT